MLWVTHDPEQIGRVARRSFILRKSAAEVAYTYRDGDEERAGVCDIRATDADALLLSLLRENRLQTIHSREQSLGDVFIEITGRVLA